MNWHKSETNHKMLLKLHERYVFIVVSRPASITCFFFASFIQVILLHFKIKNEEEEKNKATADMKCEKRTRKKETKKKKIKATTLLFEHSKEVEKEQWLWERANE